ncbi:hypothetical protein CDCA_CDCA08G2406 [Cyanidium caldarium]|uniref:Endonuclease/exonuclease/phosphatase domain-containing protein n=1 Tax=Cyanidium caldarium TaxID=2771 RepID=A0AAV9IWD8_CYACA|nr:hypothetical protein CDCA_CDCA08G2406 [Cyanidium caldarium]
MSGDWAYGPAAVDPDCWSRSFRVVSYNTLAQAYVRSEYFPHCPRAELKFARRSSQLWRQLQALTADVLCLQEVDWYESGLSEHLHGAGYDSVFHRRTGQKRDGCCIAVRRERFALVQAYTWEYNRLAELHDHNERLVRDNVGMAVLLRERESGALLLVATTHLFWDPHDPDVKVAQAAQYVREVVDVAEQHDAPPIVLTGDLNATPDSAVLQLLLSGKTAMPLPLPPSPQTDSAGEQPPQQASADPPPSTAGSDLFDEPVSQPVPIGAGEIILLPGGRSFASAYAAANDGLHDAPWTNRTPKFSGTLDYILIEPARLQVVRVLRVPDLRQADFFLPNCGYPSDHIPVVADLCFS